VALQTGTEMGGGKGVKEGARGSVKKEKKSVPSVFFSIEYARKEQKGVKGKGSGLSTDEFNFSNRGNEEGL